MNIYMDDDIVKTNLVSRIRKAGHQAVRPIEVGLAGVSDPKHFVYAIRQRLILLTRNRDDFIELHEVVVACGGQHPGILIVCSDNDPTRDLTDRGIVNAIAKLERSGAPIANAVNILNHWR